MQPHTLVSPTPFYLGHMIKFFAEYTKTLLARSLAAKSRTLAGHKKKLDRDKAKQT
jgi:hypothetical protein